MQLYASDQEGKKCFARFAQKGNDYFCLECAARVRVRSGTAIRPHFYHLSQESSCRQSGKTEEHIAIQQLLLDQIGGGILEMRFESVGRIADLFWEEKKLIFEVQCSPITQQEIEERNRDYESLGYSVIWILYDKTFSHKKKTGCQKVLTGRTHYYSNAKVIYDMQSRFQKKVVEVSSIMPLSFSKALLLDQEMHIRFYSWAYYTKGDFLWHALQKPQKRSRFSLNSIPALFKAIWQLVLERSCK